MPAFNLIPLSQYAQLTDALWVREHVNGMLCRVERRCAAFDQALAVLARSWHGDDGMQQGSYFIKNGMRSSLLGAVLGPLGYMNRTGRIPRREEPLSDEERKNLAVAIERVMAVEGLRRLRIHPIKTIEYWTACSTVLEEMSVRVPLAKRRLLFAAANRIIEHEWLGLPVDEDDSGMSIEGLSCPADPDGMVDDDGLTERLFSLALGTPVSDAGAMTRAQGGTAPIDANAGALATTILDVANIVALIAMRAVELPGRCFSRSDYASIVVDVDKLADRYLRVLQGLFTENGIEPCEVLTYPFTIAERPTPT